jgi:hypothetical protein
MRCNLVKTAGTFGSNISQAVRAGKRRKEILLPPSKCDTVSPGFV